MLLGRSKELARIEDALKQARRGHSSALVIRGEAGVGKSALLHYVHEKTEGGVRLSTRGIESESEIAFSGLLDLLRPISRMIETLPDPQRAALAGALAIGPAVPGDRFTIYAACLGLLATAAEDSSIAVIVDDLQWLDPPSAEGLLFAARRLEAEGVAMIFSVREGEGDLDTSDLDQLVVEGLDEGAARQLLDEQTDSRVAPDVASVLIRETNGNPLALIELTSILEPDELAGRRLLQLPLPVGPSLEHALLRRIQELPRETQAALLIVAASDTGAMEEITSALRIRRLDGSFLEAAEGQRVLRIHDGLAEFSHPLLRSAIYHAALLPDRRRAHAALAEVVARPDRRAWHRASATAAPDEEVASELEAAGADARVRGGYAAAAATYEKAARLSPDEQDRARRLLEAASLAHRAGLSLRALDLLSEARAYTSDPLSRAEMQHLYGSVQHVSGSPFEAADLLWRGAKTIASIAPDKAALMLGDAAFGFYFSGRVDRGVEAGRLAHETSESDMTRALSGLSYGTGLILDGRVEEGWPLVETYIPALQHFPQPERWFLQSLVAHVCCWVERFDLAEDLVEQGISGLRAAGAPALLPYVLAVACENHFRTGDWERAYAEGMDGIRLALETGQEATAGANLITTGRIEAVQGRFDEALESVDRALEITRRSGARSLLGYAHSVLGLAELTRGSAGDAIVSLETSLRALEESKMHNPNVVHCVPDLVEAYVASGQIAEAQGALKKFERMVSTSPSNFGLAALARCRGLVDDDPAHFEESLRVHDESLNPFERARTLLYFGEKLRRSGRRGDAREPLRAAISIFDRLPAQPWADRAGKELTATGERSRSRRSASPGHLTPQEMQVAMTVGRGATNREAATALFLSPKTIEYHLSNVYSKLGLRSRSELAAHMVDTKGREP